jgi:SAM-dependent methyltransferase
MTSYSIGYQPAAVNYMVRRTVERNAQFALPHLASGCSLLDCGCGPGSITLGLAKRAAPGAVIGVDLEVSQVEIARASAEAEGLANVSFEVADIYALPFEDERFDMVFCHTVLCHLTKPERAISEMRRVLKPGGCIAVRDIIATGCLYWPKSQKILRGEALIQRVISHAGGDPDRGIALGRLLLEAGFSDVFLSASYDTARTLEEKRTCFRAEGALVENSAMSDIWLAQGWTRREELSEIAEEWRKFGDMPDTLFALPFGEAIGWKS